MSNSITNYQTSFKVAAGDDNARFADLMRIAYAWVCSKERDKTLAADWDGFQSGVNYESLFQTGSSLVTRRHTSETSTAWALRLIESPRKTKGAWWYSDIGLKLEAREITLHVRISFAWPGDDLRATRPVIHPTVPKFVKAVLEQAEKAGWNIYSEREAFKLSLKPWAIAGVGAGRMLARWILASERRYPLVVFNGRRLVSEACSVARELMGKCVVAVIDDDSKLAAEIRAELPADLAIHHGCFRVFFPMVGGTAQAFRHRWYDPSDSDYRLARKGLVAGLLRNHSLTEGGAIRDVDDINHLLNMAKIRSLQSQSVLTEADFQPFFEEIEKTTSERDQARFEADQYATEVDQLEKELGVLKQKLAAMEAKPKDSSSSLKLPSLPSSLIEIVEVFAKHGPDCLMFAEPAFKSAKAFPECEVLNETWEILHHLGTTLYRLKFEEKRTVDYEREFTELAGYRYSKTEGPNTKGDARLAKLRKISHMGKDYEIWTHIGHGNQGSKCVRVHFAFDDDLKKIVVGHVGRHMDNSSTRKLG